MIDNNIPVIGDRYYRAKDNDIDNIEYIRIKKIKNSDCFIIQQNDGILKKVNKSYFNDFIKLIPDARLFVAAVKLQGNLKDVIVNLYKTEDLEDAQPLPFAVCRQSVFNIFANIIRLKDDNNNYIGISINRNNCPQDVDFKMFLACNDIIFNTAVSCYIGDTLDDILSMINKRSRYDDILKEVNKNSKDIPNVIGVCNTLESLMRENDFMFDFNAAFGITKVNFKVKIDNNQLDLEQVNLLEDILRTEIINTYVSKYNRDEIDTSNINGDYVILCDTDNDLYLVVYDKGEYLNRTYRDKIRDKRDYIIMMRNILSK